jgi:hypothetical protein
MISSRKERTRLTKYGVLMLPYRLTHPIAGKRKKERKKKDF